MYATEANLVARFGGEIDELKLMHASASTDVQDALKDATE